MAEINGGTGTAGDQGGFPGERTQEYYVVDAMTIVLSSPSVQIPRQSDWAKCPKDTLTGCGPPPTAVPALSTVVGVQRPTAIAETANAGNATGLAYVSSPGRERRRKLHMRPQTQIRHDGWNSCRIRLPNPFIRTLIPLF
ncbi:hypothetical protein CIRG_05856 [Coccidioides immitis RMSCC 2394]|uniref:Uncharacterized protein n=1 Tax=Coccidioides immitis RMSCC 2394 TaxID=404692 RepID=A0A0J6YES6_COCIT|nr:hypothetical protein CIRG_05856 [Coccidioides immitis RMSCC 2394]